MNKLDLWPGIKEKKRKEEKRREEKRREEKRREEKRREEKREDTLVNPFTGINLILL